MIGRKTYIANIFVPLILGVLIYFLFRPDTYISIFLRQIFHEAAWGPINGFTVAPAIGVFLRNFGCDLLWAYSLVFAVHFFADSSVMPLRFVFVMCILFEFFIEYLQYIDIVPGVFDIIDMAFEAFASLLASIIILLIIHRGEFHEKETIA